ncbi:hypothetical protein TNCV_3756891 [Trichonephila clavipes]|nr:hypothetical protein TNCV_3756891 [Trichonephila clavipes]
MTTITTFAVIVQSQFTQAKAPQTPALRLSMITPFMWSLDETASATSIAGLRKKLKDDPKEMQKFDRRSPSGCFADSVFKRSLHFLPLVLEVRLPPHQSRVFDEKNLVL